MRYPVDIIGITQSHHQGLCLDLGYPKDNLHPLIKSCDNGYIYKIEQQKKGGNVIYIKHDSGIISQYAHLDTIKIKENQSILMGEIIGTMGSTGTSATATHLHFGLFSEKANIHGKSDLDPLHYCQVFDKQKVSNSSKCKNKILYAPEKPDLFIKGEYTLLLNKALRTSPKIENNIAKVKDIPKVMKPYLTSDKLSDKAYLKRGTDCIIREIVRDKQGRVWGKISKFYLVLIDRSGIKQAFKIK